MHDSFTNRYSFKYNGNPITLVPVTSKQVYEDWVHLKKENERVKIKENNVLKSSEKDERLKEKENERKYNEKENGKEK